MAGTDSAGTLTGDLVTSRVVFEDTVRTALVV